MKLNDFLKPYCSLKGVEILLKNSDDTKELAYNFNGDYLSRTKEAVYNDTTHKFEPIDPRLLNGEVITWGTYINSGIVVITIYVRMVD